MIMIGPGTGVAPYRAFLQNDPEGSHWLFFGERNRAYDFYYEDFFTSRPHLRLSTAFSRDQKEKRYVQHCLLEEGADVWEWITSGASIFICGDAKQMAKDVTAALETIITQHGGEDGQTFLRALRKEGRLQLDVY
jgi:sulfite reductase (NADPH) flavoprotein alpha-component